MKRRHRHLRIIAALGLATLAIVLALPAAQADSARTGDEPWYQQSTDDARRRARVLFAQALDKHQQLLRADAMELYERALALWDNPDIRWNLALVLEDLGQYVRAHEQLEDALRWDAALGVERLREVQDRMRALEAQRLARIEADSTEPGADVKLDGQPWFQGVGRQSVLVVPGTHYIASTRSGYIPVAVSTSVVAGGRYRVTLRMVIDQVIETRRWSTWTPWSVLAAGAVVTAVGAGFEWQARVHLDAAVNAVMRDCNMVPRCSPIHPPDNDRAVRDNWVAIGAFAAGGTAVAVGAVLAWLNQPRAHRPEVPTSPVELIPTVSPGGPGVSALVRF